MKSKKILTSVLAVALLLALTVGLTQAQGPEPPEEQDIQPQGDVSITAMVGSKISYQGVLKENGSPVTGSRDMTFRLYSNDTCTTQVGSDIVKSGVPVTDGLFTVALDVYQWNFNGQGLWLGVEVGGVAIGCQEILPVPYALSLRPGASIDCDYMFPALGVSNVTGNGIGSSSENGRGIVGTSVNNYGVYGLSSSTDDDDAGVYGLANGGSGTTSGVYGANNSISGTGVKGKATATSGYVYGVTGLTDSPSGVGVFGWAGSGTSGTHGRPYGVYGYSNSGHGVYGITLGDWSWISGVYGKAVMDHANGVTGWNTAGGTGVYAWSETGTGIVAKSGGSIFKGYDISPSENLRFHVSNAGNVYADGSYLSPASDFAEMLPAVEGLEPGDVLVIGSDGQLLRSSSPYATSVMGVYSTKPGFVGGSDEEMENPGKAPLAIVGIVPVKASAENGPIAPGDLLTTSSTPGHAMFADHFVGGAIIGKALEPLEEGAGIIQMLVMLQ